MRNKIGLVGTLLFTAGLALVACAPGSGSGTSPDQEPAQDIETPTTVVEEETPTVESQSEVVDKQLSLEGNLWGLESYAGSDGQMVDVIPGSEVTAEFVDGQINGSAGCNNYHASYELDGNHISVGPAATTRMFCAEPEGVMEQENQYLTALQSVTTYEIEADVLELFELDGTRMATYQAAASDEAADVAPAPDEVLANTEYKSEWTESGIAPLMDGEYREQAAPGSASEIVVRLTEHVAYGQLSDGRDAAAVILVNETGGSGTFYDLAVVVEEDGQPVNIATTFLGDRVKIENLVFVGGEILVEMVTQGPDDPFCCPTQRVVQTYELQGDQLVQTSSRIVGTVESGNENN